MATRKKRASRPKNFRLRCETDVFLTVQAPNEEEALAAGKVIVKSLVADIPGESPIIKVVGIVVLDE
jgi:hypothetical protein